MYIAVVCRFLFMWTRQLTRRARFAHFFADHHLRFLLVVDRDEEETNRERQSSNEQGER